MFKLHFAETQGKEYGGCDNKMLSNTEAKIFL